MNRREWLGAAAKGGVALAGVVIAPSILVAADAKVEPGAKRPELVIYKDPHCGCCDLWVDHVKAHGFPVKTFDTRDLDGVKSNLGVPRDLTSCHTTIAGRYVVEGHVPADVIDKLLAERPRVKGIAVAGMPIGSPGMEVPGRRAQPYDVIAFASDGSRRVFARK